MGASKPGIALVLYFLHTTLNIYVPKNILIAHQLPVLFPVLKSIIIEQHPDNGNQCGIVNEIVQPLTERYKIDHIVVGFITTWF